MSKLVIVESPAKARTIGRMLGKDYIVTASMGHIRDLPEHELGVDIANNFAPQYVDTPRSGAVLRNLRSAAKKADEIFLAPDPDREGEAIAWHLWNVLKSAVKAPFHRVTFHEITRSAIENAMQKKGEINLNLVDAQQARRVLDRIVGYQVSPLLWRKLEKGSSAGRVQSAALRLVVDREREITGFQPEEYWNFKAEFATAAGEKFTARLFKINQKDFRIATAGEAAALEEAVKAGSVPVVGAVTRQQRRRFPQPPFTTSTLQQAANSLLHFSATGTMRYAQQLYEGVELGAAGAVGLITYMRTDSVNIAREAQIAAAGYIRDTCGEAYVPARFNTYKSRAAAQEAHEAIRPTDVRRTPESVAAFLDAGQLKLYTLVWKRFVASQMTPAVYDQTAVDVNVDGSDRRHYTFRTTASVLNFPGFTAIWQEPAKEGGDDTESRLPAGICEGDTETLRRLVSEQKFTEPPPRYTEATLVKALEENGVGRPSTYATILRTIQDREYVKRAQNKLHPTELGFEVNDFLADKLPELFNIGFTAQMETQLDEIEEGRRSWTDMMTDFYAKFAPWVQAARDSDAPDPSDAARVVELFDGVEFAPPRKIGRRSYDDRKFFTSVEEKFRRDGKISAKQFAVLIALAARYAEHIAPDKLAALPPELREAFDAARREQTEREAGTTAGNTGIDYAGIFAAFDQVKFEPPVTRGRRTYDDRKFCTSLRDQALSGRALSKKQLAVLARLVTKYRAELAAPDELFAGLPLDSASARQSVDGSQSAAAPAAADPGPLLEKLAGVKQWAAPTGKGRFVFDDQKFFRSLESHYKNGRAFSAKQLAALEKLAAKYGVKQ